MRIDTIHIHNFRSISDAEFKLSDYSLLIGENNSGKSTIITALRAFYEDDGFKFNDSRDFPKFETNDKESWLELEFSLTDEEFANLKYEYRIEGNKLKVRRYFKSANKSLVDSKNSNIYAYENGKLSNNYFYGAKNVSQAKLGRVIFIPEISKVSDNLKFSGPSPLRNITNFVFSRVIKDSEAYSSLNEAFESFNKEFEEESKSDEFSLNNLKMDINEELQNWDIEFGLRINPISPNDIVKNLFSHYITDKHLNNKEVDINSLGQGVQRHIIYILIKLTAKYVEKKLSDKKEFSPDFTLILFEEPEAFLHPTQQEQLNLNLSKISKDSQVLITTHSPLFISKNIETLTSLIKLKRENGKTNIFQITKNQLDDLFSDNASLFKYFSDLLKNSSIPEEIITKIKQNHLGENDPDLAAKTYDESFKFFLWLDAERSSLFFAKHVIICEGATEKSFFNLLLDSEWQDLRNKQIYFLDSLGKYNIHRFMNLFKFLGINHSVLFDSDEDSNVHFYLNDFIQRNKNEYTIAIDSFPKNLESFLGVDLPKRPDLKPLSIIKKYTKNEIPTEKIKDLRRKIEALLYEY